MKTFVLFATLTFSLNASAHIEPGTWTGLTPAGEPCSMIAGEEFFQNNFPHPLNERVPVEVNGDAFIMQHPPVIDTSTGEVKFNHDAFHGVLATKTGGRALIITMTHEPNFHGPKAFRVMDHQWKTDAKTSLICNDIKHLN